MISENTKLCISLSARPGGFGNLFHNYLYEKLRLDFIYKAGTTTDLKSAIAGVRALNIRGCGLSMPFKVEALNFVNEVDERARKIGAINTIVNEGGKLVGSNTDFTGVVESIKRKAIPTTYEVALLGSGGMARATAFAIKHLGFENVTLFSRNEEAGIKLSQAVGFSWKNLDTLNPNYDFLVNTTSMGMQNSEMAFSEKVIAKSRAVLDVVTDLEGTPLVREARRRDLAVISGFEITVFQGEEQFRLYTGVTLTQLQVEEAAEFVRSELRRKL